MSIKLCVFDAYGTLFDVASAARALAQSGRYPQLDSCWQTLAEDWRLKQLHYTWLRAITDEYDSFWQLTKDALDWALENHGLHGQTELREALLDLYWHLDAHEEVPQMLPALRAKSAPLAILSNGSTDMLNSAVSNAGLTDSFDAILSVDAVQTFKPMDSVYALATDHFHCAPHEVLFVSSNGWDIAGASGFGFETVWVNRRAEPEDRLPHRPAHILPDLTSLPELYS